MNDSAIARRGLAIMLGMIFGIGFGTMAFNAAVDPYGYFGSPTWTGWNQSKPKAFAHDRYLKAALGRRVAAECVLAGSSRVGEGIDPADPALAACDGVVDLSLAGPTVGEMTQVVRLAQQAVAGPRRVILSLDFFAFNPSREPTRGGAVAFSEGVADRALTALKLLASLDTLGDSVSTVLRQDEPAFQAARGSVDQAFLQRSEQKRSTRATFALGVRAYILHNLPGPRHEFPPVGEASQPAQTLQRFLLDQHRQGVEVVLFFSPVHAWHLELLSALELWQTWQEWRTTVIRVNAAAAAQASRNPFALWDFATYGAPSNEAVPGGDAEFAPLASFWDTSHFRRVLGGRMLRRMLGAPDDFGVRLDSSELIAQRHTVIATEREHWRQANPRDVADVHAVVACFAPLQVRQRLNLPARDAAICTRLQRMTR